MTSYWPLLCLSLFRGYRVGRLFQCGRFLKFFKGCWIVPVNYLIQVDPKRKVWHWDQVMWSCELRDFELMRSPLQTTAAGDQCSLWHCEQWLHPADSRLSIFSWYSILVPFSGNRLCIIVKHSRSTRWECKEDEYQPAGKEKEACWSWSITHGYFELQATSILTKKMQKAVILK